MEVCTRSQQAFNAMTELSGEIYKQKTKEAQRRSFADSYMVVCKCHKATQLYCCVHNVPVCGECICHPEHNTCVVRAYSEWIADGSDTFPPKCGLCFQLFSKSSDSVIRLSCLHVLHTSCLLLHLEISSSWTVYTCPSCNLKSHITMLDKKFDALSLLASGLSPVLSSSSVAFGPGISGPVFTPGTTISGSSEPVTELCKDQTTQKLMQQNCILSESSLQTETEERNSIPSARIDMESSNRSSTEIIGTQTMGSPKPTKVLSRKCSSRGDKRTTDCPAEKCGKGTKYTSKGLETQQGGFLSLCSPATKHILPVTSPSHKTSSKPPCAQDVVDGRWQRYCRATSLDPRKILFFCATLKNSSRRGGNLPWERKGKGRGKRLGSRNCLGKQNRHGRRKRHCRPRTGRNTQEN